MTPQPSSPPDDLTMLDRVLEPFSGTSLLTLLRAALDSPVGARFHDHLLLAWTRALSAVGREGRTAGAGDLPAVLSAAVRFAERGVTTGREPNSPAARVRFTVDGHRLLVHPGDLDHPLVVLRSLRETAAAVDEYLTAVRGFGIADVLDLALRHTDHAVTSLAPTWHGEPAPPLDPAEVTVTDDQVTAAASLGTGHLTTSPAHKPDRSALALAHLTRDLADLPLVYEPGRALLGPVLLVTVDGHCVPVPGSTALEAACVAAAGLLAAHPPPPVVRERLHRSTIARVARLLGLPHAPDAVGEVCRIGSPQLRLEIAVVATLGGDLPALVEKARAELADSPPGTARLVVYGGPAFLGPEVVTDTLMVHVEELAEMLGAAGGDLTLLALWALELTGHPGADAVAYTDVLDAWTVWHRRAFLLPPGPPEEGVVVVGPCGWDVSWERAAWWAPVDDLLDAAGLAPAIDWPYGRLTEAPVGSGQWADLAGTQDGQRIRVCAATWPSLVIVAQVNPDQKALLDEAAFAGLADGIRGTLAGHPHPADHATLPAGRPLVLRLTETITAHQPPTDAPSGALPVMIAVDEERARVDLALGPDLLTAPPQELHRALGLVLHHTLHRIRTTPGTTAEDFDTAWNAAIPVLAWYATDPHTPPPVGTAPFFLSGTPHIRARALRVAADAVRTAAVPTGTFTNQDALHRHGPAQQLLHALEAALADQLRAHHPDLLPVLVRYLNAALATRHHGRQETTTGLARTGTDDWANEALNREHDGAHLTGPLQLLIQQALITTPTGTRPADQIAVADLTALAELVLRTALVAVPASRRLHGATLTVEPIGLFTLRDTTPPPTPTGGNGPVPAGFDTAAYHRARDGAWLDHARTLEPQPLEPEELFTARAQGRVALDFTPLNPPTGSTLAQADRELHTAWGCGLDALAAVLATAADWPTPTDGVAMASHDDLTREAATWSALPEPHIRAAIDRLVLHPGNATSTHPYPYTEVERRTRPTTHPLIGHGDHLLIAPWLIHTARQLYATSLADGRLPRPDTPKKATNLLDRHRQQHNNRLETDLAQAVSGAGLAHRANLDTKPAAAAGIPGLTGEIDLLVADPARRRLWVIEAKNPHRTIGVHHTVRHVGDFITYRGKLLAKAQCRVSDFMSESHDRCRIRVGCDTVLRFAGHDVT
ncbi:hypothetical protein, partial [Streptomyces sp. NPDC059816]|uniref:hypothetical protein n=1 Tax=Streptomyces sp. NPDC059816 TaxID=3346960 RepID=UPI00365043D7